MLIRSMKNTVAAIMVLAAATVWAQSTSPAAAPSGALATTRAASAKKTPTESKMANPSSPAVMHQRMDEMEGTLNKMHALLKQMRAKAASSSKDSLTTANLDMWELMVGELDRQFEQLRKATAAREDFEARRAAMYKTASDKADASAAQARQAMAAESAGQAATGVSAGKPAPAAGAVQAQPATPAPPAANK